MKWTKGSKEGTVVAGGQGNGDALTQLSSPAGLFVDTLSTVYVIDTMNYRVMRWPQGAEQGSVVVGAAVNAENRILQTPQPQPHTP
ncbi:unnamed protein product [Rotaria socialis]|uniref:Uncharacterized protein n=1 Tax=Rotaria socialis TaxID=392032 RepID=A0A820QJG3_9BILA|nr:unnamed protein product [Rotaria socialis]CAF3399797.1 unnamed protein product [Rotaria socialis]CAF3468411.1 unnamed protein product [Rotaria socialis]CAF3516017.1 unnamed protein product [Rotaria socialis]CAF4420175.1 unnamed protein product [Rotaria socialis]